MADRIDLTALYQAAFGYQGRRYFVDTKKLSTDSGSDYELNDTRQSNPEGLKSLLGVSFFMPVYLDGYKLPNEPLVTVTGGNRIIRTDIDGNEGSFKERWCKDDYRITIRGIAINEDNFDVYPEEQLRQIRKLCEKGQAVQVDCDMLSIFNISLLAIEQHNYPALEGSPGMQPYEITAYSDKEFELELKTTGT